MILDLIVFVFMLIFFASYICSVVFCEKTFPVVGVLIPILLLFSILVTIVLSNIGFEIAEYIRPLSYNV